MNSFSSMAWNEAGRWIDTKAQKEFLYDYYIERGKEAEANAIWKED